MDEEEKYNRMLWKSREIMFEILKDRNYSHDQKNLTYEEFVKQFIEIDEELNPKDVMTFTADHKIKGKILIIWITDNKLCANSKLYKKMDEENVKRAIAIVDDGVTSQASETIKKLYKQQIYIDIYTLKEAQYNITKHKYASRHIICNANKKKEVFAQYGIEAKQCPKIDRTDPMVRHLGAIQGQLIKIIRNSHTQPGHQEVSYRIVN